MDMGGFVVHRLLYVDSSEGIVEVFEKKGRLCLLAPATRRIEARCALT